MYAKNVIEASKGLGVSYVLKHFPGYGNNLDTHNNKSIDSRSYEEIINNDIPPFVAGINAFAEAILISHNIVSCIDPDNPASLSRGIHKLLRDNLQFSGIIITDDLSLGAIDLVGEATIKAIQADNTLIITTDYLTSINAINEALNNKTIILEDIEKQVFRILAWKYYKGLL